MTRADARSSRVLLEPDISRCAPSGHCPMRSHCARYMAAVPAHGGAMMDGTTDPRWSPAACSYYLPVVDFLPRTYNGPERRAVRPWPTHTEK